MWGAIPFDQLACRIAFKSMRYNGLFTVPDTDKSLSFPGSLGGMNRGSMSFEPNNQYMFVNDMRLGLWVQMIPADTDKIAHGSNGGEAINTGMGSVPLKGTPCAVNKNRFMSPLGIPCQAPPFGTLSTIDMNTRKIVWQVPVGTVQDTGPFDIKNACADADRHPDTGQYPGDAGWPGVYRRYAGLRPARLRQLNR
nr:Quinate/shikimate dehydrogenase (quinone) [Candidatus Pantoea persica]